MSIITSDGSGGGDVMMLPKYSGEIYIFLIRTLFYTTNGSLAIVFVLSWEALGTPVYVRNHIRMVLKANYAQGSTSDVQSGQHKRAILEG